MDERVRTVHAGRLESTHNFAGRDMLAAQRVGGHGELCNTAHHVQGQHEIHVRTFHDKVGEGQGRKTQEQLGRRLGQAVAGQFGVIAQKLDDLGDVEQRQEQAADKVGNLYGVGQGSSLGDFGQAGLD